MKPSARVAMCGISSIAAFLLACGWAFYWVRWSIRDVHGWEPIAGFAIAALGVGAATLVGTAAGGIGVWTKVPKGWPKALAVAGLIANAAVALPAALATARR